MSKFKKGDFVIIGANNSGHGFSIGECVYIGDIVKEITAKHKGCIGTFKSTGSYISSREHNMFIFNDDDILDLFDESKYEYVDDDSYFVRPKNTPIVD